MLKVWNASLVLGAGTLAIVGTFLVRSGVLNSIHAFGASTLGVPFVILIAAMVAGSIYLVVSRRDVLRSEHSLDSLLSREAVFLLNNLVLVGLVLRDLLGHVLPADLGGGDRHPGVGRRAVVRPLHGAAGARARAALRDRPDHRVAACDARATLRRNFALPLAAAARDGDRARVHGRPDLGSSPATGRALLRRRVRARQHRPGVLARRRRAAREPSRVAAASRSSRWSAATAAATAATSSTSGIAVALHRRRRVLDVPAHSDR